jgi:hypothetical protein
MTNDFEASVKHEQQLLDALMAALPLPVRKILGNMRLSSAWGRSILALETSRYSKRLREHLAAANAYAFAAWHYDEINEGQWQLLRSYAAERVQALEQELPTQWHPRQ